MKISKDNRREFDIIPAMDIIGGECVRLIMGDYSTKKIYSSSPELVAKEFEKSGLKKLHIVDLDGAKKGSPENIDVIRRVRKVSRMNIQYGGGVRRVTDAETLFNSGANKIILGSAAIENPGMIASLIDIYGYNSIILGVDIKDGKIAINGWKDQISKDINQFILTFIDLGVKEIICTDINKDGMLTGPSFEIYQNLIATFPNLDIIASGGVRDIDDINTLKMLGLKGVIVGKALYEKRIDLNDLKLWLQKE